MMVNQISDMNMDDLRAFVEDIVDDRMRTMTHPYTQKSTRPLSQIIAEMEELLIESKPGDPSVVEMLREDRDR
jgi:hypothetical protein